jgi:peptidyl-prolyl cis-trans isomerase SurA
MRRLLPAILFLTAATAALAQAPQGARLANAVAVIVNDAIITLADINRNIAPAVEPLVRQHGGDMRTLERKVGELREQGTEDMVIRRLILDDFTTSGYNIPDSVIEDEIKSRAREHFGDRRTLTKTLQAQGMTYEGYRTQIREDYIIQAMRGAKVSATVIISPAKIEKYYAEHPDDFRQAAQVKVRMMDIAEKDLEPGAARRKLEALRAQVIAGASFAELASQHSEGSQRAKGGDWGWIEKDTLRPELAALAFKLQPGEMSEVVTTPQYCYLMLVEAIRPAQVRPLAEVREEVERLITAQERTAQQAKYIERLKAKAFVRYF